MQNVHLCAFRFRVQILLVHEFVQFSRLCEAYTVCTGEQMYSGLQRKPRLWFLGKAFQLVYHLHCIAHQHHCACSAKGFVFTLLLWR